MTYEEIIAHYGTAYALCKAVGFAPNTPFNWRRLGYVPVDAQLRIQRDSKDRLKYKYEDSIKKGDSIANLPSPLISECLSKVREIRRNLKHLELGIKSTEDHTIKVSFAAINLIYDYLSTRLQKDMDKVFNEPKK